MIAKVRRRKISSVRVLMNTLQLLFRRRNVGFDILEPVKRSPIIIPPASRPCESRRYKFRASSVNMSTPKSSIERW
jgi:hypothetical protein